MFLSTLMLYKEQFVLLFGNSRVLEQIFAYSKEEIEKKKTLGGIN